MKIFKKSYNENTATIDPIWYVESRLNGTKIVNTRNPFSRLHSAWSDKFRVDSSFNKNATDGLFESTRN